ncbi:hypothetical protein [Rossellomorea sp. BNER]|uniref:hypothetical protein n=1 Tax=Rossellomorea sp. BNER TaxID=2962031 RepID=UPI003AF2343D|nr:hypothetical protein [Rossellomorea sp. BNER]
MKKVLFLSFLLLVIVTIVLFIQNKVNIIMGLWVTYGLILSVVVYFFPYNKNSSNKEDSFKK